MEGSYQYETWLSDSLGVSFLKEGQKWDEEKDVAEVVKRIQECPNLKYLELEGNTLGVSASKAIGKALESKGELEAALWKDLFTGRLKNEIPQSFNFLFAGVDLAGANLQRLDLSDNAIGPVGMVGLGPFFKSKSSFSLKELILNNNGFGPEGGSSLAEALRECLRLSRDAGGPVFQLKVFVCGRNRLENKAAKRLAEFFKEVGTLEEVHMPQNGIYKEGIGALSDGLRQNKNMKILNLNDNTIRGEGFVKLAGAISEMKNLKDLSLSDCLLKGNGTMAIINALKANGSVTKVNFSGNEISKASGRQAAEALRALPNLEEVNLSANSLGTEGGEFVTNILKPATVIIEDDDGTEDEEEESDEDAAETSNVYEDISSADEQSHPVDLKLKISAIETFIQKLTENNFLLLDKDSPYDVLKQHISDVAHFGEPIDCFTEKDDVKFARAVDAYCWIHSTFTVQELHHPKKVGKSAIQPGVGMYRPSKTTKIEHKYYQWVGFYLLFQAATFYLPRFVWKLWEGGRLKVLTVSLDSILNWGENDVEQRKGKIVEYFLRNYHRHNAYAYRFIACEIVNCSNVFAQILLTNVFLGYHFSTYGQDLVRMLLDSTYVESHGHPMDRVFPKVSACQFNRFGPSGNIIQQDVLCVLSLNVLNEKIFIFLWVWFVFLAAVSLIGLLYRIFTIALPSVRTQRLQLIAALCDERMVQQVSHQCGYGDWFILCLLGKNMDPVFYADIITELAFCFGNRYRLYSGGGTTGGGGGGGGRRRSRNGYESTTIVQKTSNNSGETSRLEPVYDSVEGANP